MSLALFLTFSVALVSLIYLWVKKKYSFHAENGFLYDEPSFPFGSFKGVVTKTHPVYIMKRIYDKFKGKAPAVGFYRLLSPSVMILDLDLIKTILIRDFDNFHNRGIYYNEVHDPLSAHLFNIEDQAWRKMRVKLTPTFTSNKMKMMFTTVLNVSNHMVEMIKSEENLDMIEVKEILAKFTTDVIGSSAFGLNLNAIKDPNSEFRRMGRKVFNTNTNVILKFMIFNAFKSTARKFGGRIFDAEVTDFFTRIVKETIDYRLKNKIERNDFMDLMIKMYIEPDENGDKLTFNQVLAQTFLFFIAGFETSSSTLTFVLYNLALNQDIQDKLRDEIKSTILKYDNKITYEAMNDMKYLQMVIDETLRLQGPVLGQIRIADNDYQIPNTKLVIRKGTHISIPTYCIHQDPEYYPEPEKFDPERFNEENKKNRHQMAFTAFGSGPRNCIGERFGYMQSKIGLISLLLNFKFHPTEKTQVPMIFDKRSPILAPPDGMWLKVEKL
ncbi:hypothetical protein PVAND_000052 [Polypedilum vanderplanki]|uniref:Cytochrome P450 n=1 Tax=Polypedilum vanderplanki TaxID=319348 RepID=A0A9J6BK52_POLVA|nr:hypothetical protein PVAND_000052 [Polypedilum vanderplanki]